MNQQQRQRPKRNEGSIRLSVFMCLQTLCSFIVDKLQINNEKLNESIFEKPIECVFFSRFQFLFLIVDENVGACIRALANTLLYTHTHAMYWK